MGKETKTFGLILEKTSKAIRSSAFFKPAATIHTAAPTGSSECRIKLSPKLGMESKAILPVSMARYDGDKQKRKQYDEEISALLKYTSEELERGNIGSMEILSSAGLQKINWGEEKAAEIEAHFFETHHALLEKQTHFYTWDDFVKKLGEEQFEKDYEMVKSTSPVGSEWYNLMAKIHGNVKVGGNLENSLEYQRREYAAIYEMREKYTHIVYMGGISVAWAYLYNLYDNLPIFTKAVIEKSQKKTSISTSESNTIIKLLAGNVEDVLLNENFPSKEKEKLSDTLISLVYAYSPKHKKKEENSESPENKESFGLLK